MKISKKLLSMVLCGLIVVGGSQLTLVKANAATKSTTSNQCGLQWQEGIRFRLRRKNNASCKDWWEVNLVCRNGRVTLEGPTNIPDCFTFDDIFVIAVNTYDTFGIAKVPFKLYPSIGGSAKEILKQEMEDFNNFDAEVYDDVFMHGINCSDSFALSNTNSYTFYGNSSKISSNSSAIKRFSKNDYTRGYINRDRWYTGFEFRDGGLYEMVYPHTYKGIELGSM